MDNHFTKKLNFNNFNELRSNIIKDFSIFKQINNLPNTHEMDFGSIKKIQDRKIEYNIKNFYMNDVISRASITMANCSREILNKVA